MVEATVPTWESEDAYWRNTIQSRPYWAAGTTYDDWRPAYQYGYESAVQYRGRTWDTSLETDLERGWDSYPERANDAEWTWNRVKDAVRDAWNRLTVTK